MNELNNQILNLEEKNFSQKNQIDQFNLDMNVLDRSINEQGVTIKPCSGSFVNNLEKVIITNEDVDNDLCCAICQDKFKSV